LGPLYSQLSTPLLQQSSSEQRQGGRGIRKRWASLVNSVRPSPSNLFFGATPWEKGYKEALGLR